MKERFLPLFSVPFPWGGGTIKRKGKNKISEKSKLSPSIKNSGSRPTINKIEIRTKVNLSFTFRCRN